MSRVKFFVRLSFRMTNDDERLHHHDRNDKGWVWSWQECMGCRLADCCQSKSELQESNKRQVKEWIGWFSLGFWSGSHTIRTIDCSHPLRPQEKLFAPQSLWERWAIRRRDVCLLCLIDHAWRWAWGLLTEWWCSLFQIEFETKVFELNFFGLCVGIFRYR